MNRTANPKGEIAMKKQTTKKQTAAKRYVPKPKRKAKPNAKPKTKSKAAPKAKPRKAKPVVVAPPPPKAKPKKSKPVAMPPAPPVPVIPVAEPVVRSKPVMALPPPVASPNQSEMDDLRRIEIALAEAENAVSGTAVQTVTNPISAGVITELTELLEELIITANPRSASTVSRLAYVLCEVMPGLQAVSKQADIALCRKCGVTFGWDRRAEAERAVRAGKYQKSISVS
jgi:hypothetical protein